ncbi:MAG: DUF2784 domain-containing protein [Rhodocyclaceae bacterium]|nr:DUF2784 domain-containing protein [Rhodocyclaceae bacterium]
MNAALLADLVFAAHFAFILFVVFGGLLLVRWPRLAWLHVPAVAWGIAVELFGWVCPLTPLEIWLRQAAGEQGYDAGFIAHYLEPLIYPGWLTRNLQIVLAIGLFGLNGGVYFWLWRRGRQLRGNRP